MPITREQPAEIFKTTDGRIFDNAEEAHCHERHVRLRGLISDWLKKKGPRELGSLAFWSSAETMIDDLANHIACVVRDTPLANG